MFAITTATITGKLALTHPHVGTLGETEAQHLVPARQLAPCQRMRVIGVENGDAPVPEPSVDLALGARHGLDAAQTLKMGAQGVVDQGHVGPGQFRQIGNFAGMVHAHLDGGVAMFRGQFQQRQRHADVVVEIAAGSQHGRLAHFGGEDRREHLLHRGLAVTARDRGQPGWHLRAPPGRQAAQGESGVVDLQGRREIQPGGGIHHHGGGAIFQRLLRISVAVETRPFQGDEETARWQLAAVAGDGAERHVSTHGTGADGLGGFK